MAAILQFSGVNCGKISNLSFTLETGKTGQLSLAGREEKSTAIDLAVGARAPDSGFITLNGAPLEAASAGSIGWVPESGGLISNLKVWENVTLPLWYHGKRRVAEAEAQTSRWLSLLGMNEGEMGAFMASPAALLTPLGRKRAGLLRGLLLAPQVLVLDTALFNGVNRDAGVAWLAALDALTQTGCAVLAAALEGEMAENWQILG